MVIKKLRRLYFSFSFYFISVCHTNIPPRWGHRASASISAKNFFSEGCSFGFQKKILLVQGQEKPGLCPSTYRLGSYLLFFNYFGELVNMQAQKVLSSHEAKGLVLFYDSIRRNLLAVSECQLTVRYCPNQASCYIVETINYFVDRMFLSLTFTLTRRIKAQFSVSLVGMFGFQYYMFPTQITLRNVQPIIMSIDSLTNM